ncbi:MAG TPA: RHS repeat-associated core domain-containing protein, partial [Longimicrobium sp.]|nr:RHS repeat-associated core domain-containing protein [Longimicrobium sp.]
FCALLLLFAAPFALQAQDDEVNPVIEPGEEPTPPTVWFEPAPRTFYGAAQAVKVHFCDGQAIVSGSTRIWLNGTAVTHTSTLSAHPWCTAVHRVSTVNLTLQLGSNQVKARACEGITTASCGTDSTTYVYATTDPVPPTASISPASGTVTTSTLHVSASWCDDGTLNLGSRQLLWNGVPVAASDGWQTGTDACWSSAASSASVTLQNGANTLQASIRDAAGNLSAVATATYTYAPALTLVTPSGVRRPELCAASCFDATLGYATPAYVSLDAPRAARLVYSSAHARPRGFVQLDLRENLSTPPVRVSLRLIRPDGTPQTLNDGRDAVFYDAANGTSRLSAWFDATAMQTGTYRYRAEVTRHFATGAHHTDTLGVRVVVVNESENPFGAGWSLAGYARVHLPAAGTAADGVTLGEGNGTAGFFAAAPGCAATGACAYTSPPGDFTTLARGADGWFRRSDAQGDSAVFDPAGRLVRVRDRFGNQTTYEYHPAVCNLGILGCLSGALASIVDPAGKRISFAYSSETGLASWIEILAEERNVYLTHAPYSRALASVQELDGDTAFTAEYDGHRLASHTDRAGNRTDILYDRWGTVSSIVGPAFRAQGNAAYRDTVRYRSQEAAVLPTGAQGTMADPADRVDPAAVRALVARSQGDSVRLALDGWGAPTEARDAKGFTSRSARNANGLTVSESDAQGNGAAYTWNGARLTRIDESFASGGTRTVQRAYDGPGGRLSREFGDTPETKYFHADASRRFVLDSVHVAGGGMTRFTYDARGRVLSQRDSAGHGTVAAYDPGGWMNTVSTTADGGRTTTFSAWDDLGRATRVTSPDNHALSVEYDLLGRIVRETYPDQGAMRYHYGRVELDSVTDQRGQRWRWTRNQLGWVEAEMRPGDLPGNHRTAVYDRRGRVLSTTDRRGRTVGFGYDAEDRLATRTADGLTSTWSYSPDQPGVAMAPSWTAVMVPNEGTDSLHYDEHGRLTRAVSLRQTSAGARVYEVRSTYNPLGGRDSLRYQAAGGAWRRARYYHDLSTGRLSFLSDPALRTTYLYHNGEGAVRQMDFPTGQIQTFGYTSSHQLSRIGWSGSTLGSAAGLELSYTDGGQVASRGNASGTRYRDYDYDPNGRLRLETSTQRTLRDSRCGDDPDLGWVCPDRADYTVTGSRAYTYDPAGNPTDRGAVVVAGNRLTAYDGWTMEYDNEGNLTRKWKSGTDLRYTWNDLGQMAQVTLNGVTTATYGYDGLGRRVRKSLPNGTAERYVYDGDDLLLQLDASGAVAAEYTYWPGVDRVHSVIRGGVQYYYAIDPQGSVLAMTDAWGAVVNQYRYGSFGAAEVASETVVNPLRFAGREWDAQAGLYYVRARWYDPALQRFTSEDPLGLASGSNLYAYVANDPVNATDPSGLIGCWTMDLYYPINDRFLFGEGCDMVLNFLQFQQMGMRAELARQCEPWRCGHGVIEMPLGFAPGERRPSALNVRQLYRRFTQVRAAGHQVFPRETGSYMRHFCANYILTNEYGPFVTSAMGELNEIQGFFMHDIPNLRSRLQGRTPWAYQKSDLLANADGISTAVAGQPAGQCDAIHRKLEGAGPPLPPGVG